MVEMPNYALEDWEALEDHKVKSPGFYI